MIASDVAPWTITARNLPHHARNPTFQEFGVVEVVRVVERNPLRLLDSGHDADLVALAIELMDRVVAKGVDEDVPASPD